MALILILVLRFRKVSLVNKFKVDVKSRVFGTDSRLTIETIMLFIHSVIFEC